jgi:hypothetical protein
MAEDAEEIPGRPEELKLDAGRSAAREQTRKPKPRDQHRSSL